VFVLVSQIKKLKIDKSQKANFMKSTSPRELNKLSLSHFLIHSVSDTLLQTKSIVYECPGWKSKIFPNYWILISSGRTLCHCRGEWWNYLPLPLWSIPLHNCPICKWLNLCMPSCRLNLLLLVRSESKLMVTLRPEPPARMLLAFRYWTYFYWMLLLLELLVVTVSYFAVLLLLFNGFN